MGEFHNRAAETPRVLWIELTSKCPFDCVFCSRKFRRGSGQHLPFHVYRQLLESLVAPRRMILNYSGESIYYPELIPAIRLARERGAFVELVSAFSSIPRELLRLLALSGLGRLTISVHAVEAGKYAEIYRHSSFENLDARLREFLKICREVQPAPAVAVAFVAMRRNLDQLAGVARFAQDHGIPEITIFPVLRRDEIPETFPEELLASGAYTGDFSQRLEAAVNEASSSSAVRLTLATDMHSPSAGCLGAVPIPFPGPLPMGARIHSCEQNPWETAHVLSNGDVVACEVLDRIPLGNLVEQSVGEIWQGEAYEKFRERYHQGDVPQCRTCAWKRAYLPAPLESEILARDGGSAQLLHGWHDPDGNVIWSSGRAAAVLESRSGSRSLHVSGLLPAGPPDDPNELRVWCNGRETGRIANRSAEPLAFGLDLPVAEPAAGPWTIEFATSQVLRPRDRGLSSDTRDLGFALVLLKSNRAPNGHVRSTRELEPLRRWVWRVDRLGRRLRCTLGTRFSTGPAPRGEAGISVVIPERCNVSQFAACLESVKTAASCFAEPVQVIAVINGAEPGLYAHLQRAGLANDWRFVERPLGFPETIREGLRAARHDWVYLLNSDMILDASAFECLTPWRATDVFAIGSQIHLRDSTRYRDETNWTEFLLEDGLAQVHDRIPQRREVTECFYAGGGASLFQRAALTPLVNASRAYSPFYWEDVEWGWRARKRGYRVLFCPQSIAHHHQHATISKHFDRDTIETVTERNRLLFQLRNLTACGSLDRLFEELAQSPAGVLEHFLAPSVLRDSLRVRLWNHLAGRDDGRILREAGAMQP